MIIKDCNGNILFEYDNKKMKLTLENAVRMKKDLSGADLQGVYLSDAQLALGILTGGQPEVC